MTAGILSMCHLHVWLLPFAWSSLLCLPSCLAQHNLAQFRDSVDGQVQAHVAQTEVDPGAAAAWLRVTDAGMEASPTATQLIRSVAWLACPDL